MLAGAAERIERHRRADGAIAVRTRSGRRVRGAAVRVEQVRHDYLFGCNFFLFDRVPTPELGQAYEQRFAALCNAATLGFYWGGYEVEEGKLDYAYPDHAPAWCRERLTTPKGHPLAWDHDISSPK